MKKHLELLLIGLALVGYGLLHLWGGQLLTVALLGLATYYFLSAFQRPAPDQPAPASPPGLTTIILRKIGWIGSSAAVVGILYFLRHWPGSGPLLAVGGCSALMTTLPVLLQYLKSQDRRLLMAALRAVLVGGLALALFSQLPPPSHQPNGRPGAPPTGLPATTDTVPA